MEFNVIIFITTVCKKISKCCRLGWLYQSLWLMSIASYGWHNAPLPSPICSAPPSPTHLILCNILLHNTQLPQQLKENIPDFTNKAVTKSVGILFDVFCSWRPSWFCPMWQIVGDKLFPFKRVDYFPRSKTVQRLQQGRGVQVQPPAGRGGERGVGRGPGDHQPHLRQHRQHRHRVRGHRHPGDRRSSVQLKITELLIFCVCVVMTLC